MTPGSRACRGPRAGQRGMAVVAALIVVALVAVIAAGVAVRQAAFMRMVQGDQSRVRAQWLARDGVAQAMAVLREDAARNPLTRLDGEWARPLRAVRSTDRATGEVVLRIEDEQGKFNLRNLVRTGKVDADEVAAFLRLCRELGVKQDVADRIVGRVVASVALQRPHGGEDAGDAADPADVPVALAVARQPLPRTLDDLGTLAGVDAGVLARLRPYVTVLPENTWINGNTASAEVIGAGVPGLTPERAREVLQERDRGRWFVNRSDFVNRLRLRDLPVDELRVTIVSQWFQVSGTVAVDGAQVPVQALVRRSVRAGREPQLVWLRMGA